MPPNRAQALYEFKKQIGTVLNCVAYAWVSSRYFAETDEYLLVSHDINTKNALLKIRRGREILYLEAQQIFKIIDDEDYRITTLKYNYVIWTSRLNERLMDWHYHQRQNNSFGGHLHIRNDDAREANHYLVGKHIPTGRVPLEDVVEFMM